MALSLPQYIGVTSSFQFLLGFRVDKDVYPRSVTWLLQDLQEISVIVMTLFAIQAVKLNKATPYSYEGALLDEEDFAFNRDKLNYWGKLDPEFATKYPQLATTPIIWDRPDWRPDIPMSLYNMITDSIKTTSGSIDSARGQASYSGQSGVQTAQLQAAASVFTKQDEIKWHNFLKAIGEKLKNCIADYKVHEHMQRGRDENNNEAMLMVNQGNVSQFNPELYYCVPYVDTTPEVMKQMEKDRAIQLNATGKMSTIDMLNEINMPNPEMTYMRAMEEQGWMQVIEFFKANPDAMTEIQQEMQAYLKKTQNND
jgi:hypothetical protein